MKLQLNKRKNKGGNASVPLFKPIFKAINMPLSFHDPAVCIRA